MGDKPAKRALFSPWTEVLRYGLRKTLVSWITCTALVLAVVAAGLVPWGQRDLLPALLSLHGALLGFGLTIFGFTILGGKDDFFEPVMKSQGKAGLDALRDMVLLLWWPVLLHGLAVGLCIVRLANQPFWVEQRPVAMSWRVTYGFLGGWAFLQTYFSMRYLFTLAIMRLKWRYKELTGRDRDNDSGNAGS